MPGVLQRVSPRRRAGGAYRGGGDGETHGLRCGMPRQLHREGVRRRRAARGAGVGSMVGPAGPDAQHRDHAHGEFYRVLQHRQV
ncbi:unnamed protein product [Ectocarpus sp. 8 AP-2014]